MERRALGTTGLTVSRIGFGAFKIGRNQGTKFPGHYELPSDDAARDVLRALHGMDINYIDTAPAYGLSESRVGQFVGNDQEWIVSTKVGEEFDEGVSTYDFSASAITNSLERSCRRLHRNELDLVFVHCPKDDTTLQHAGDVVGVLQSWKREGRIRALGFSGRTADGFRLAFDWADVLMVEYHRENVSLKAVMSEAHDRGLGVVVKKGLASGHLPAADAIRFVLDNACVDCLVIGGLNVRHLRDNVRIASVAHRPQLDAHRD